MREIHKNINVCSNSAENSAEKSAGNWQISLIISLLLLLPGKDKISQVHSEGTGGKGEKERFSRRVRFQIEASKKNRMPNQTIENRSVAA